jgi:flagellar biosynthesis protein FlhF
MTQAMKLVRDEMGDEAIIVSSRNESESGRAFVTAALEAPQELTSFGAAAPERNAQPDMGSIVLALNAHGVPAASMDKIIDSAWEAGAADPTTALATGLDRHFKFAPLRYESAEKPIMLVGPHGAGKSVTAAKLAARGVIGGHSIAIATVDTIRAGGVAQLSAFTEILGVELEIADGPAALAEIVARRPSNTRMLIDTPGTNPFDDKDLNALAALAGAAGAEPVLVMAAGGDALEAAEIAHAFASIGARRLIASRLDTARRLGAILAAAGELTAFSEFGVRAEVADGLTPVNPVSLARLLMAGASRFETPGFLAKDFE